MAERLSRRSFVGAAGAAAVGAALPSAGAGASEPGSSSFASTAVPLQPEAARVGAIASSNGLRKEPRVAQPTGTINLNVVNARGDVSSVTTTSGPAWKLPPARLQYPDGRPRFGLSFYAINKRGALGSASLYPSSYAAHNGREGALRDTAHLYERPS